MTPTIPIYACTVTHTNTQTHPFPPFLSLSVSLIPSFPFLLLCLLSFPLYFLSLLHTSFPLSLIQEEEDEDEEDDDQTPNRSGRDGGDSRGRSGSKSGEKDEGEARDGREGREGREGRDGKEGEEEVKMPGTRGSR